MNDIILPLGIDRFGEIRAGGYYYIDKTEAIEELLRKPFKVNLITRPRRFGKTLMMDTIGSFFDIRKDTKALFSGLKITGDAELCAAWQNQWPVIFLTLKEAEGNKFETAYGNLAATLSNLYKEHTYLLKSDKVDPADKEFFHKIQYQRASLVDVQNSLYVLMRMMHVYFGRQVILLIDEYDVPLAGADEKGYYADMLELIRRLMSITLKTNPFLKFAVITGCLRIAKESIFTGTNHLVTDTISGERFNEYFGFTANEVAGLLADTGFEKYADKIKFWYDGYHFGTIDIYCPWDVLNYVNAIQDNPRAEPKSYWEDTSHNGILRTFVNLANGERKDELAQVNEKFETLLAGGCIRETIEENLTYDTLHSTESNLWSLLYLTGYLTQAGLPEQADERENDGGGLLLKIPNEEVRMIFRKTVAAWYKDKVKTIDRSELFEAMWGSDAGKATELLTDLLFETISYYDYREDFYHAFLAGVFAGAGYIVESNREHGLGRTDLVIRDKTFRRVMILEVKHADTVSHMEAACAEAVKQIDEKRYAAEFSKGYHTIISYGISFCLKECLVRKCDEVKR